MAGKYGIGARVRDKDGDVGTIIGKRKGERLVKYDSIFGTAGLEVWATKSFIKPLPANDDTPASADQEQGDQQSAEAKFKVGDRVRVTSARTFRTGIEVGDEAVITGREGKYWTLDFTHPTDGTIKQWARDEHIELVTEADWQPKVGDRVRLLRDGKSTTGATGKLATVVAYSGGDLTDNGDYLLKIDPPVDYETIAVTKEYTRARLDWFEPLPVAAEAHPADTPDIAPLLTTHLLPLPTIQPGQLATLRVKVTGISGKHANVNIPGLRNPSHGVPLSALTAA